MSFTLALGYPCSSHNKEEESQGGSSLGHLQVSHQVLDGAFCPKN